MNDLEKFEKELVELGIRYEKEVIELLKNVDDDNEREVIQEEISDERRGDIISYIDYLEGLIIKLKK